jgi:hypothetical protein
MRIINISVLLSAIFASVYLSILGCGVSGDGFYSGALGSGEGRILIANANTVAPVGYTVSMYDIEGNFIQIISDMTVSGDIVRGLAYYDDTRVVVATDTPDELKILNIFTGAFSTYAANATLFTGNIFHTVKQSDGVYLTVEGNTIEKFVNSARTPSSGNPYINTPLGGCTISVARGLAINSLGDLLVTTTTNNSILRYDISGSTAACLTANATFGANQPIPIVVHPNGNLYFGTQVNDAIYSAPEDLSVNPAIILSANANINNPTAMGVLPNGNLIVANDGIDTVVEITTAGVVVNSNFIKNALVGTPTAILVISPQ